MSTSTLGKHLPTHKNVSCFTTCPLSKCCSLHILMKLNMGLAVKQLTFLCDGK